MTKEQTFEHPPRGHVALLAYDSVNDRFQVVHVDANGLLQVDVADQAANLDVNIAAQAIDVEVTQATPADLVVGSHGYDGSAWRKQPLIFGYTDRWAATRSDLSAVAGANTLSCVAVPAGQIYVLQALTGLNSNSICSMRFRVKSAAVACTLTTFLSQPLATVAAKDYTGIVLKEGDLAEIIFEGCTLNDDIYLVAWGYKMSINM